MKVAILGAAGRMGHMLCDLVDKSEELELVAKCDIRVGDVKACEKVKKSKKLLKFTIFDGAGERTIVSGIAMHYDPEELVGKKILFVSNLKPVKLCGVESQGMILSAVQETPDGEKLQVLTIDGMPAGSQIC